MSKLATNSNTENISNFDSFIPQSIPQSFPKINLENSKMNSKTEQIKKENLPKKLKTHKNSTLLKIQKIWQSLGPGLVTGASDDDPSGITTYSQAGATFGLNTLWTAFLTFPLMTAIQEMCGRIGIVQQTGLMAVIKANYSRVLTYSLAAITIPACILNIAADLGGMGAVANMVFPTFKTEIWTGIFATLISILLVILPYKKLENCLKWLCMVLLVYLIVPFLVSQNWTKIGTVIILPQISLTKEFLLMLVAILGTTISPYLFIWQISMEKEDLAQKMREKSENKTENKILIEDRNHLEKELEKEIKTMKKDNFFGMFFANLVMFFVMLTAGTILYQNGGREINSVQDAAAALRPLAGENSYILFAIGVIGTGFLAVPVLAGACAYIISDLTGFAGSMNAKFKEAKTFYLTIIGAILAGFLLTLFGFNPVLMLIWTAVIYGMVSPFLIGFLLHICNNSKIMGKFTNSKLSNFFGISCFLLMAISAIALIWTFL